MKEIELTQGKVALVDNGDFDELSKFKWYAHEEGKTFYACRIIWINKGKHTVLKMHRQIMQPLYEMDIDHIDGDGLNNQRENLRSCTHSQNLMNRLANRNNTSGFKGVVWHKRAGKWRAQIMVDYKRKYFGLYRTAIEAARAYNEAAKKHHGGFANLNKVEEVGK
jgi:hypothetical protein